MKKLLLTSLLFVLVACSEKENPGVPPVVPPQPEPEQSYCKAEGKKFSCMSALYFYGKECPASGPAYIESLDELKALVEKSGQAVSVKMKDGKLLEIGVGMAMPCQEL